MEVRVQGLAAVGNLITVTATVLPGVTAVTDRVGCKPPVFRGVGVEVGKTVPRAAARVMVCGCMLGVAEGRDVPSFQIRVEVMVLIKTVLTCGVFSSGWVRAQAIMNRTNPGRMRNILKGLSKFFINKPDRR